MPSSSTRPRLVPAACRQPGYSLPKNWGRSFLLRPLLPGSARALAHAPSHPASPLPTGGEQRPGRSACDRGGPALLALPKTMPRPGRAPSGTPRSPHPTRS